MKYFCVILIIFWVSGILLGEQLGCQDENGNFVDWFYAYKLPKHPKKPESSPGRSGLNYLFITSDSESTDWTLSKRLANDSNSIMGNTLDEIYSDRSENLVLMYNDEPPNNDLLQPDGTHGHTKGVVVANEHEGFWLIHSVPKYPPEMSQKYDYPETGTKYGQSFLCVSFKNGELNKVGKQLQFNEPHIYSSNIPEHLKGVFVELEKAQHTKFVENPPFYNLETLVSAGGVHFKSFAKSRKFKKELYQDWVAPSLNDNLYVESWRNGGGDIPSDCTKHNKVYNIKEISIKMADIDFETSLDHSKWVVTAKDQDWICVGDINRQHGQLRRGGGTLCQESPVISKIYRNSIKETEPCPRT